MRRHNCTFLVTIFTALPFAFAACGGDEGGSDTEAATTDNSAGTSTGGDSTGTTTTGEPDPSTSGDDSTTTAAATTTGSDTTGAPTTTDDPGTSTTGGVGDGAGRHCATPNAGVPAAMSPAGPKLSETITLTGDGVVGDVDVFVHLTNVMKAEYLVLSVVHNGTTVVLHDQKCEENKDIDVTFDDEGEPLGCCTDWFHCGGSPLAGTFQPGEALSAFAGLPIAGDWTFEVLAPVSTDPFAPNQGILDEWCVDIEAG